MDELKLLQEMGLVLPSPTYIAGAVLFGIIGMAAFWYGRKASRPGPKWIGVGLMFYPYAISATWLLYVVGIGLCIGLYISLRQ